MGSYDTDDFQTDVIERSREVPVLVDFWAAWCGPCRVLGPVLERLADEADGRWRLAKVDTDRHAAIAQRYGVRGIPNAKLFVDGEVVDEFVGALPEDQVRRWLQTAVPAPRDERLERAEQLLAEGDEAQAAGLLSEVVAQDPGADRARTLLGRALLFDDPAAAVEAVEPVGLASEHHDAADAVRTLARLLRIGRSEAIPTRRGASEHTSIDTAALGTTGPERAPADEAGSEPSLPDGAVRSRYLEGIEALARRDFDAALGAFIDVIARDRAYDDDGARRACLAIFHLLGPDHPTTRARHVAFSNAVLA